MSEIICLDDDNPPVQKVSPEVICDDSKQESYFPVVCIKRREDFLPERRQHSYEITWPPLIEDDDQNEETISLSFKDDDNGVITIDLDAEDVKVPQSQIETSTVQPSLSTDENNLITIDLDPEIDEAEAQNSMAVLQRHNDVLTIDLDEDEEVNVIPIDLDPDVEEVGSKALPKLDSMLEIQPSLHKDVEKAVFYIDLDLEEEVPEADLSWKRQHNVRSPSLHRNGAESSQPNIAIIDLDRDEAEAAPSPIKPVLTIDLDPEEDEKDVSKPSNNESENKIQSSRIEESPVQKNIEISKSPLRCRSPDSPDAFSLLEPLYEDQELEQLEPSKPGRKRGRSKRGRPAVRRVYLQGKPPRSPRALAPVSKQECHICRQKVPADSSFAWHEAECRGRSEAGQKRRRRNDQHSHKTRQTRNTSNSSKDT